MNFSSFLVVSLDFLCIIACHLQIVTVLLPFQFGFALFLFLLWLLWLRLPKLCWIKVVRVSILLFFLSLEEILLTFYHWVQGLLWVLCIQPLLCYVPSMSTFWRIFYKCILNFIKCFFCIYCDDHMEQDKKPRNKPIHHWSIYNKGGKTMQWRNNHFSNKWCSEYWTTTCLRIKLENSLTSHKKINSRWIKDINVRLNTIKTPRENTGRMLFDLYHTNIFWINP